MRITSDHDTINISVLGELKDKIKWFIKAVVMFQIFVGNVMSSAQFLPVVTSAQPHVNTDQDCRTVYEEQCDTYPDTECRTEYQAKIL